MKLTYLAIENDLNFHQRESEFWLARGISSTRTSTMSEAIDLASKQPFLFIGINASNVNYQPCLGLLREVTNDPILISTTTYTMQEQCVAIQLGADLFGQISDAPNDNYKSVMALIQRLEVRSNKTKPPLKIAVYRNILLSYDYRTVFVDDVKVDLTKIEFELLNTLISNPGRVFTFEQLYDQIWSSDCDKSIPGVIKNAVARLRKKIGDNGQEEQDGSIIENLWGVGYRCPLLEQ